MSEAIQATPDTSTNINPAVITPAPVNDIGGLNPPLAIDLAPNPGPGLSDAPPITSLEFIPEAFKTSDWASKYKTPDDFFKGVDNMAKLIGKKQIVQGIQTPPDNATPEELDAFYLAIGRPESMDKYSFSEDIKAHEGIDLAVEKQGFAEVAFQNGLTQKQTDNLFKQFIEIKNQEFAEKQNQTKLGFDQAVLSAFGNDFQGNLGLAKRGAKALGIADTLDNEGLSANPSVLKLCAELGKYVGEDSFISGSTGSKETKLEEARKLQASDLYKKGDKETHRQVSEIYRLLYPG